MEYVIATFHSRNVAVSLYNNLSANGVACELISTPRSANVGCGLSVKFAPSMLSYVANMLTKVESFVGFFRVRVLSNGTVVTRV